MSSIQLNTVGSMYFGSDSQKAFADERRRQFLVALVKQRDFLFVLIVDDAAVANAVHLQHRVLDLAQLNAVAICLI